MTRDAAWLEDVLSAVDLVFFGERLHDDGVTIRWKRWRRTKMQLRHGCYWADTKLIEVHPVLRNEWVPLHVVVSVCFHEALHHIHGGAPESWHSDAFRRDEQRDPYFAMSEAWLNDNLARLLAARPPRGGG